MKILVVGGGGREHALAWKLGMSPQVEKIWVAPGNAGTTAEPRVSNLDIDTHDLDRLADFASDNDIDLTVVGPEAPLVDGISDRFAARKLKCFGPPAAAARLEGSKEFAKSFLNRHQVPTAAHGTFSDPDQARAFIRERGAPIVVKADGLAAGKGVTVAQTEAEAIAAVEQCLQGNAFGEAGRRVVVEEFLRGEEASFICIVSGRDVLPLASSQDHKARDDGDQGPNTGGMGAYSPAPVVNDLMHRVIMDRVILPVVNGLADEGLPYVGFLYAGLMIDADGVPAVLEFNCRFGDPETQPIMMRLKSDLAELLLSAVDGNLGSQPVSWDERAALGVVLAAGGYPAAYEKGHPISGLEAAGRHGAKVFHAGTRMESGRVVTSGGRVLCVTALGESVARARSLAYQAVDEISWPGMFCRRDIGYRAINR